MKIINRAIWVTLIAAVVAAMGCSSNNPRIGTTTVTGSGVMAQEDRPVGGFSGLVMSSIGDIHITVGAAEALRVEAEDNLLQHIETFVQGGTLVIETENGFNIQPTLLIEFHLTVVSLDNIVLSGVSEIEAAGLNANQFSVTLSGVGGIDLTALDATNLIVTMSGVGGVRIAGQVDSQTVTVSGVGDYDADNLQSDTAVVVISALGDATVWVSTTLMATVTGTGSVFYIGDPVVTSTITGNGTVEQIP